MRKLIVLVLLLAGSADGAIRRFGYRVVDSSADPTFRMPQLIVADTVAECPSTDVGDGDFCYPLDVDVVRVRAAGVWVIVGGQRFVDDPDGAANIAAAGADGVFTEGAPDLKVYTSGGYTDASNWSAAFFGGSGFLGTVSEGTGPNPKQVDIYCDPQYTASAPCISFWVQGSRVWYFDRTNGDLVNLGTSGISGPDYVDWDGTVFASLGTPGDGTVRYCTNCTQANPCASGGTGAFAIRINGAWSCTAGGAGGGGVSDGDKGDITVTGGGATWTIDNDVVSFAKMQDVATDRLLGRDTAASGDTEEITVGGGIEFTGATAIQRSALTGDVTAAAGSGTTDLDEAAVEVELEGVLDLPDLQGILTAAKGGTGDDTSGTTGVSRIAAGNWTYDAGISHLASSTSADLRGVLSDEVGTGGAMFGLISTMADDLSCSGDQVVKRNAGDTAFECGTVAGGSGLTHPQVMSRVSLGF